MAEFPDEIRPIDGTVVEGHDVTDDSYLTGEPYMLSKTPGLTVLPGAINGESALVIRADKLAIDSRYAKIMEVMAATLGIAVGQNSDVTTEAADVVVMDSSFRKIDEFLHLSRRMRRIARQNAIGGMALSMVGMIFAAAGYLPPVAGAICQKIIEVVAVLDALRVAIPPKSMIDFETIE